eukprot:Pgem_evm1s5569
MVAALAVSLSDKNILVVRTILDVLVNYFPFDQIIIPEDYRRKLLRPALYIVLKRDMSLNR